MLFLNLFAGHSPWRWICLICGSRNPTSDLISLLYQRFVCRVSDKAVMVAARSSWFTSINVVHRFDYRTKLPGSWDICVGPAALEISNGVPATRSLREQPSNIPLQLGGPSRPPIWLASE